MNLKNIIRPPVFISLGGAYFYSSVFTTGVPEYGKKLGVSYDQAAKAVDVLAGLEQNWFCQSNSG